MVGRHVLRRRVDVHQVRIDEHRNEFEDPYGPLSTVGHAVPWIEECRGSEAVSKKDQEIRSVQFVHDNLHLVVEDTHFPCSIVELDVED